MHKARVSKRKIISAEGLPKKASRRSRTFWLAAIAVFLVYWPVYEPLRLRRALESQNLESQNDTIITNSV